MKLKLFSQIATQNCNDIGILWTPCIGALEGIRERVYMRRREAKRVDGRYMRMNDSTTSFPSHSATTVAATMAVLHASRAGHCDTLPETRYRCSVGSKAIHSPFSSLPNNYLLQPCKSHFPRFTTSQIMPSPLFTNTHTHAQIQTHTYVLVRRWILDGRWKPPDTPTRRSRVGVSGGFHRPSKIHRP